MTSHQSYGPQSPTPAHQHRHTDIGGAIGIARAMELRIETVSTIPSNSRFQKRFRASVRNRTGNGNSFFCCGDDDTANDFARQRNSEFRARSTIPVNSRFQIPFLASVQNRPACGNSFSVPATFLPEVPARCDHATAVTRAGDARLSPMCSRSFFLFVFDAGSVSAGGAENTQDNLRTASHRCAHDEAREGIWSVECGWGASCVQTTKSESRKRERSRDTSCPAGTKLSRLRIGFGGQGIVGLTKPPLTLRASPAKTSARRSAGSVASSNRLKSSCSRLSRNCSIEINEYLNEPL